MDFSKKLTMPRILFGAGMLVAFIGFLIPVTKINVSYFEDKESEYRSIADTYQSVADDLKYQVEGYQREINGDEYTASLQSQSDDANKRAQELRSMVSSAPTQAELDAQKAASDNDANTAALSSRDVATLLSDLTSRMADLQEIDLEELSVSELDRAASIIASGEESAENAEEVVRSREDLEAEATSLESAADSMIRRIRSNEKLIDQYSAEAKKNEKLANKYTAKADKIAAKIEKMGEALAKNSDALQAKADAITEAAEAKASAKTAAAEAKADAVNAKNEAKSEKIIASGQAKRDSKEASVEAQCEKIMAAAEKKYEKTLAATEKKSAKIMAKAQATHDKKAPAVEAKKASYLDGPTADLAAIKADASEKIKTAIESAEAILQAQIDALKSNPGEATTKAYLEAKAEAVSKVKVIREDINKNIFDAEKRLSEANMKATIEQNKLDKIMSDAQDEVDKLHRHTERIKDNAVAKCDMLRAELEDIVDRANLKAEFIADEGPAIVTKAEDKNDKALSKAYAKASDIVDGAITVNVGTAGVIMNEPGIAFLSTFLWVVCLACLAGMIVFVLTTRIVYEYLCWLIACGFGIASWAGFANEFQLGLFTFAGCGSYIVFIGMAVALAGLLLTSLKEKK